MRALLEALANLVRERVRDRLWEKIGLALSIIVVFCITYVLILPALTLTENSDSKVIQQENQTALSETETSVTETIESSLSPQEATIESPPETTSPSTTTEDTETPQSSVTQESAPQPTGNQAGQFEVEADNVIVKVSYEAETFTEAVSLKVSAIDDSSGYEQKLSSLLEEKNQILTQTYSYDIAFVNGAGAEVEPSKAVDVSIQFKDAVTSTNLQDGWKLYHFVNNDVNEVEDLTDDKATDIKQDNLENVTSVEFKSDSFSPYVIAGTSYEDLKPYIISGSFQGTTTETPHSDGSRTLQTTLKLNYDIPKTELNKTKSYAIELPQDTTWTNVNENHEYTGKDEARDAFKYRFVQENGKKYIVISFLDSYLATAGEDDHTQKVTVKPAQKISKGGSWSNDNREVNYKLDINPYAEDLAAGKASYTVTDTLEYQEDLLTNLSYDLKQESVKLYDSNNQELDKSLWSWTVEKTKDSSGVYKSVLKLTVPNKQILRLEYSYTVSREVAADDKTNLSVKNTAEVSGFKSGKTEKPVNYTWQQMSTSGTAQTTKYFKLTKVDLNNFAIVLPNAIFEVRENITDKVVATYKTGTDGTLYVTKNGKEAISKIEDLKNDTLYYIVEVTAPDGYKLPDASNQKRYYFYFSETGVAPLNLGDLTDLSSAVNLAKQSKQEYVENSPLPTTTTIAINKKWLDANGQQTTRSSGTININLMQVQVDGGGKIVSESRYGSYQMTPSGSDAWTLSLDNLPTQSKDSTGAIVYYQYYVIEDPIEGYDVSYEVTKDNAVASGDITLANKAQQAYELPETGGLGPEKVVISGAIASLVTLIGLLVHLFIRHQGRGLL
ncbi:TPA: Cna B-type domain-containing protein [Streptococcus suis]|nr:Cna B-type domain-containing protein [Streptococcus suis]HEM2736752.1 Cna B-type domain-containing protein [Streptococcus suis]